MYLNFIWGIILAIAGGVLIFTKMKEQDYNKTTNMIGMILLAIAALFIIFSFLRVVPAGTVGIVDLFGNVSTDYKNPGLNLVNPFARLVIMNIKTEEETEVMNVPSKEGLSIDLDVTMLYRVKPEAATRIPIPR